MAEEVTHQRCAAQGARGVQGAQGVQVRKAAGNRVTKKMLQTFLAELSVTCNVTASTAAAGISQTVVYQHRRKSPAFAAAWEAAILEGYARLELVLLESALATYAPAVEGAAARPKVSDQSALRLLQHHRQQVSALRAAAADGEDGRDAAGEAEWADARAELEARLLEMHGRMGADD